MFMTFPRVPRARETHHRFLRLRKLGTRERVHARSPGRASLDYMLIERRHKGLASPARESIGARAKNRKDVGDFIGRRRRQTRLRRNGRKSVLILVKIHKEDRLAPRSASRARALIALLREFFARTYYFLWRASRQRKFNVVEFTC